MPIGAEYEEFESNNRGIARMGKSIKSSPMGKKGGALPARDLILYAGPNAGMFALNFFCLDISVSV